MESRATRRLQKEYEDITRNYGETFQVELQGGNNWQLWYVSFTGAEETVFAGERFTLEFKFSSSYPIEAPDVTFHGAYPHHEHVYSNGYICLSILYDDWTPSLRVSSVALSVLSMLSSASHKSRPANDSSFVQYANGRSPKSFKWIFEDTTC